MKLSPFQGMIDQSMLTNKLLGTMNTNMANFISEIRNVSSAPIREINQEIEKTPQKIGMAEQDVLNLAEKLKEAEVQCRAFGDTSKANKLKEMLKMINAETTDVKGSMQELRQYIEKTFGTDALKQFDKELKNIDKTTQKVGRKSNFGSSLKTALGIGTVALGIRKTVGFLKEATTESIDFVETQNLFNVSMGKTVDQYGNLDREASKYYTKAMAFQEKLSDKLKINIEESMEYQALFNAMSKSMGIGDEPSYKISENFTKLGYDLSSLYNIDPENAMQKLRAGLSGQTKPLRDLGLDITQQSLEPLLDELGIERSTKQLSQAEKMIARYIVVLRQASLAHGDFAKTMDSPANQLRIFNAQLTAFKRNMGNLWQGLLGNILPYVNAIMMVINELLKMVAKLFGFEVSDQNVNISAGVGADDLVNDLGAASEKAKELKKQLMGFDEINNITLPDKSSGGSGEASVGGIDQKLLDAMKEYDNMMDKVKSKATEIRDKMMEWLGFHKTGDGWGLNEGLTNAEKILDIMKMIGIAIGTWKVSSTITNLFEKLGIMEKADAFKMSFGITLAITGIFAQYKGTQHLLDGDVDLFTLLETLLGTAAGTWGIVNILKATSFGKTLSLGQQIKIGLGVMLTVQGIQVTITGVQEGDLLKQILGTLEAGFGGFLIGNSIGGLKLGLTVGLTVTVATVIAGLASYKDETDILIDSIMKRNEEINNHIDAIDREREAVQKELDANLAQIGYVQNLTSELENLVETNGKVKKGYEGRVQFILNELNNACGTEYKMIDGTISKYQDLKKSIEEVIKKKKAQIILEANQKIYTQALEEQLQLHKDKNKALDDLKTAEEELAKAEKEWLENRDSNIRPKELDDLKEKVETLRGTYDKTCQKWKENTETIIKYENLQVAVIEGNSENIEKAISELSNTYVEEGERRNATLAEQIEMQQQFAEDAKEIYRKAGKEINKEEEARLNSGLVTLANKLTEQTKTVETLTDDQINAWSLLADNSTKVYKDALAKLPPDTKKKVEQAIKEIKKQSGNAYNATSSLKNSANNALSGSEVEAQQKGKDYGMGYGKGIRSAIGFVKNAAKDMVNSALSSTAQAQLSHSPSKKTRQLGIYNGEGFALGIKDMIPEAAKNAKDLALSAVGSLKNNLSTEGIMINPNDFKIDTNQFIDYGQISGAIQAQSNVNVSSDIEGRIENAIYRGLSNATIPVEIEATTDEGVIFKKVQTKAKEFKIQTGEPAFDF